MSVFTWKRRRGLAPARLELVLVYSRAYDPAWFDVYPDWL